MIRNTTTIISQNTPSYLENKKHLFHWYVAVKEIGYREKQLIFDLYLSEIYSTPYEMLLYLPHKKVAGYYVIPPSRLSVWPSIRPSVRQRFVSELT